MKGDDLDQLRVSAPLYVAPSAYLTGLACAALAASLWALWWPLGALAWIVVSIVGCVAFSAHESLQRSLAAEFEANRNTGPGEVF